MLSGIGGHLVSAAFLENKCRDDAWRASAASESAHARRALIGWRKQRERLGPASSLRTMLLDGAEPLAAALGFEQTAVQSATDSALIASLHAHMRATTLVVTAWGAPLDPFWRLGVTESLRRSCDWCVLFNGQHWRIVDAVRLFARRHVEFDLSAVLDDERTFTVFWTLANVNAMCDEGGAPRVITGRSLRSLVDLSDRYAADVCRSLKDNVLAASTAVIGALAGSSRRIRGRASVPKLDDALDQALIVVYRLVFLLFAEARALVPIWHPVYRESYSVDSLRTAAESTAREGLWDAMRAITRLAAAGCVAGDLRVTAFNGRLFAPSRTPLEHRRHLDDDAARTAILALTTRKSERGGREAIAYRDLGVEQLGAVYETLLDYRPQVERDRVALVSGSGVRKATGTFYTPQPIAEYVVRRTLGPLTRDARPEDILRLHIVDPAMGSGAFLVAACRYLAGAYEAALVQHGGYHASEFDDRDRAMFRRLIAEHCLYGVDLNPMAAQLARLSLWLTTLAADRPLSFLDHRLQVGDSLLGAWVSSLARHPSRAGDRRSRRTHNLDLFEGPLIVNALRHALPVRFSLEGASDTVEAVRTKERAFAALEQGDSPLGRWKRVADAWCGIWLSSADAALPTQAYGALSDAILTGRSPLPATATTPLLDASAALARHYRLFHWELEFPEVFFTAEGVRLDHAGFDAIIGNPPWEMLRADDRGEGEAGRTTTSRSPVLRFSRDAGVYAAQSAGHANSYQLFVERAVSLCRPGGRIGLVLPSGITTDRGSGPLRRLLFSQTDVDSVVGFDNHRGVFPIHRSVRFALLTATGGRPTDTVACRFGLDDPAQLEAVGDEAAVSSPWFTVRLSGRYLDRVSGPDLSIPWLRTQTDLVILERAASRFAPLGSPAGWNASFGRELNATDDRDAFGPPGRGLPIVEGKQLQAFSVDLEASRQSIAAAEANRRLKDRRHLRARLAYRDVAAATNRMTLIAAILPSGCVSTHTLFCLRTPLRRMEQQFLCGLFNSFVVNYLVRLVVTTHVTTGVVERLPIPAAVDCPGAIGDIAALARLLGRRHDDEAFARLQARTAELYGLSPDEFAHVLSTFPLVEDEIKTRALEAFAAEAQKTRR